MLALISTKLVFSDNVLTGLSSVDIVISLTSAFVISQLFMALTLSWLVNSLVVVILKLHVFISPLALLKLLIDINIENLS